MSRPAWIAALVVFAGFAVWLAAAPKPPAKMLSVRWTDPAGQPTDAFKTARVTKTDAEWRAFLSDEEYRITRSQGTERPFCGIFHDHKQAGIYTCRCCGLPLFSAKTKFESGTGWPSFFAPFAKENVKTKVDRSHGMVREEIVCARCDAHLGHVFEDGPRPTGLRYCLNSASLVFVPSDKIGEVAAARPVE
ncbi:MAG TPA: peptide-methionine (R)-S-oxide reductase MsrB [Candidatus Synoicihabitans sp.]|nr:peptide-methionine (R)-S-oxide reductase MsrB [Candidatus Synoicihabitans sp.]